MTTTTSTTTPKNVTNVRLFVLFVLLMLSSVSFAQGNTEVTAAVSTEVSVSNDVTVVISTENTIASMDFAVWFMGSKKTSNSASNGSFSKKQLINSGITTNSVLIRSFLKKINTQENGVA